MADVWDRLFGAFRDSETNWQQTVYVYRLDQRGRIVRPYLLKSEGGFESDTDLLSHLRDKHGGGEFRILIRNGSTMVFAGEVAVWGQLYRQG